MINCLADMEESKVYTKFEVIYSGGAKGRKVLETFEYSDKGFEDAKLFADSTMHRLNPRRISIRKS